VATGVWELYPPGFEVCKYQGVGNVPTGEWGLYSTEWCRLPNGLVRTVPTVSMRTLHTVGVGNVHTGGLRLYPPGMGLYPPGCGAVSPT
jgi:hypothetical protein